MYRDGRRAFTMTPAVDFFVADQQRATDIALDSTPARDLYVVMAGLSEDGVARFSVLILPLVMWLWIAGGIIAAGGLLAAWPARGAPRPAVAAGPAADERGEGQAARA